MTRQQAKELLPIIQAFAKKKPVELTYDNGKTWYLSTNLDFSEDPKNYRIKPEPREFWLNEYDSTSHSIHYSYEQAIRVKGQAQNIKTIHVREILTKT